MIAAAGDPLSPHESTSKQATTTAVFRGVAMATSTDEIQHEQEEDATQSASGESASDDEEDEDDHSSEELQRLRLDSTDKNAGELVIKSEQTTTPAEVPVKRIRRKRKRMSADERRIRHREVQRQFMKRKRARMGEMRKTIRALEAQHRLLEVTKERKRLETQQAQFNELLAGPGSGWVWDDTSHEKPQAAPEPHSVHAVHENAMVAFHHNATHQHYVYGPIQYITHPHDHVQFVPVHYAVPHHIGLVHGEQQPPPQLIYGTVEAVSHAAAHRSDAPHAAIPWDDILDAVTTEAVDFTF